MRVLMLDNEFPPIGGGQGVVNKILLERYRTLPEISIDLLTSSRSRSEDRVEQFSERIRIHYLPVGNENLHHSSAQELLRFAWLSWRRSRELINGGASYDLCFAFSTVPAGFVAWQLFRRHRLPFIVRSPGVDIPGFEARYRFAYPVLSPVIKKIWSASSCFVVSSSMHEKLAKKVDPGVRTEVIVNAVDTGEFSPAAESPADKIRMLCVARLVKRKGVDTLLQALRQTLDQNPALTDSVELVLVGTGDDEDHLKQLARNLNLERSVRFRGAVTRAEMPAVYRSSSLFVLPSHNEGMSNAALEALASGVCLVLTAVGGSEELVTPGDNGFIVPVNDVSALAAALAEAVTNRGRLLAMGRRSREKAAQFAWDSVAERYLSLMRRTARRS